MLGGSRLARLISIVYLVLSMLTFPYEMNARSKVYLAVKLVSGVIDKLLSVTSDVQATVE